VATPPAPAVQKKADSIDIQMIIIYAAAGVSGFVILLTLIVCCCRSCGKDNVPPPSSGRRGQAFVTKSTFDGYNATTASKSAKVKAAELSDSWLLFQEAIRDDVSRNTRGRTNGGGSSRSSSAALLMRGGSLNSGQFAAEPPLANTNC
jgi:hypothetical protein